MKTPTLWLAATAIALLMAAAPALLDGPSDIEVMQLVAADKADAEAGK